MYPLIVIWCVRFDAPFRFHRKNKKHTTNACVGAVFQQTSDILVGVKIGLSVWRRWSGGTIIRVKQQI